MTKFNNLQDSPEGRRRRQQKRRDKLHQVARELGFDSWYKFETAVLNQSFIIKKEKMMSYYILQRNEEYQIVSVVKGNDPLYGYGSWNLHSGPFDTWEEADEAAPVD